MKALILATAVLAAMPGLAQNDQTVYLPSVIHDNHIATYGTFVLNEADLHCKDGEKVVDHKEGTVHTFKCGAVPVDPAKPDWKLKPMEHWVPSCSAGYELWSEPNPDTYGATTWFTSSGVASYYIDSKVDIDTQYGPASKVDNYECRPVGSLPKDKVRGNNR
jgi:hypothetical protein